MSFIKHKINLSEHQLAKVRTAARRNLGVSIDVNPKLPGNIDLYLTKRQINKFKNGKPVRLDLSPNQLKRNGGFIFTLPLILGAISAASAVAGTAAGIAKTVNEKKAADAAREEQIRHNQTVENLLKTQQVVSGSGAYLPRRYSKSGKDGYGIKKCLQTSKKK